MNKINHLSGIHKKCKHPSPDIIPPSHVVPKPLLLSSTLPGHVWETLGDPILGNKRKYTDTPFNNIDKVGVQGAEITYEINTSNSPWTSTPLPPIAPSIIPPTKSRINSYIDTNITSSQKWTWSPFVSSARNDGLMLHHWVKSDVKCVDYPYARFNIHLRTIDYDYECKKDSSVGSDIVHIKSYVSNGLSDPRWTQSETDTLLELCQRFELRWPVIVDRWMGIFGPSSDKKIEDLQHRYYRIGNIITCKMVEHAKRLEVDSLKRALRGEKNPRSSFNIINKKSDNMGMGLTSGRDSDDSMCSKIASVINNESRNTYEEYCIDSSYLKRSNIDNKIKGDTDMLDSHFRVNIQPLIYDPNTGISNQPVFDLETENKRRQILEMIWVRTKEDEKEEEALKRELKHIEARIRKFKMSGGHILAAAQQSAFINSNSQSHPKNISKNNISKPGMCGTSQYPVPTSKSSYESLPTSTGVFSSENDWIHSFSLDSSLLLPGTIPTPTPGTSYLQSGRLSKPTTGGQFGPTKASLKRLDIALKELKISERPIPTKRVCDMYDTVRRDILMLFALQKIMWKKEAEVVSRRKKLVNIIGENSAEKIACVSMSENKDLTTVGTNTS